MAPRVGPVCFDLDSWGANLEASKLVGATLANDSDKNVPDSRATTVFFSYSRVDQARAMPIIRMIEQSGFDVWWDGMLEAGVEYVTTTEEALETAKAVVVLWSRESVSSHWVRDEAMSGRERSCLVPLSLDGAQPPLGFRQFQVIDMDGWRGDTQTKEAQQVVNAVAALHKREPIPLAASPKHLLPMPSRRGLLYLAAGGTATIAGGYAMWGWLQDTVPLTGNGLIVLPFKNDSSDASQQYLAEGLSSELRSTLARNPGLRVVARSSSEAISEQGLDAVSMAAKLDVNFVVEGAIRVTDSIIEITADLIDGATGVSRWSNTFNHPAKDIHLLEQTMAEAISAQLSQEVSASLRALQLGPATKPEAFDAYLRAWSLYRVSNSEVTDLEVLATFDKAIEIDPGFAAAHAGRALVLTTLGNTSTDAEKGKAYHEGAYESATKAAKLGPDLDEVQSILALILFHSRLDIKGARKPFELSLKLGGGSAPIQARYAEYASLTDQSQEASNAMEIALALDPLNPYVLTGAAGVHYAAGRYDQSIDLNKRALKLNESTSGANAGVGWALIMLDRAQEALDWCAKETYTLQKHTCLAVAHSRLGNDAAAKAALADLVNEYGDASLYQQGQILAQWERPEDAMKMLAKAYSYRDVGLIYLGTDPMLDPLRSAPEFKSLQDRLGFT